MSECLPIIARFNDEMVFLEPDGNLTLVFWASGFCEMIVAKLPARETHTKHG